MTTPTALLPYQLIISSYHLWEEDPCSRCFLTGWHHYSIWTNHNKPAAWSFYSKYRYTTQNSLLKQWVYLDVSLGITIYISCLTGVYLMVTLTWVHVGVVSS